MSVSPITAAGQILDTMTDALILLEPDGSIRLSNRATLELLECNEKELNGTQFGALTADKESADNFLEKTMRTGKSINEELIFSTKTGKNIPVLISASVIQDRTKTIVGFVVLARDITERKQLEESIRYHASLVETVSDAIVSSDKDYKIITWNKGAEEIYGWRKEEVIGKNILDILKPVYLNAVIEDMRGSMDRIGYWEGESIQQKKDGTKLNSLDSVSMIKDAQGNNIGAVSVFKDITERKHMEEALKESEERFFKAFRASPDAISIARLSDGIFLEVNDSYLEATGYTREELIGRSADLLNMWANPEQKDRMTQSIRNLVRMRNVEFQFRTKSGEIRTKLISNEFIHLSGVPCFLVVSIDITERKKAETALQQQKELTDRILATTPNAVLVIGADSKIELANLAYCNIFEKSVDGVVGKSISEIMPVPELLQAISKAASLQESHVKCEFKYKVNNRGIVFVANILQMQRGEVQLILNDVTEERERQDRLYLTDRLASVGEMASGIAHELNNPLTSVIGLSGLLVKMDMPEDVKEDMIAIRNEAQRAATIVRNLLTFARRHSQTREFVKVSNIVEDVIRLRSYEQKVNNITITADFSADLPEVLVDYFQIQQVFLNIILNAESAMIDAHGKGTLSIVGREAGKNVVVSFADDGPGIPSEIMGRIFDPFFTTKEVGKGTGLGLSICYGIVTAHGGKIYARSEYGQGATFVVELPVNGGHQVE
jgi:PAS domain S-box-containing protein